MYCYKNVNGFELLYTPEGLQHTYNPTINTALMNSKHPGPKRTPSPKVPEFRVVVPPMGQWGHVSTMPLMFETKQSIANPL